VTGLRLIRYGAWALVAVVAIAAAVYLLVPSFTSKDGVVTIGGPFTLTDQNGATVTEAALQGHPSLIYFGYTFCPDVCPTTLFDATTWMKSLGPDADKLKFYFVTVDPARDTQQVMNQYLQAFDHRMVGLTGGPEAIEKTLKEFRIYARKVDGENGSYTMDHSASVYMFDSKGRFAGVIAYQEPEDQVLPKLRKLLADAG
jgi:protein SCO1/2